MREIKNTLTLLIKLVKNDLKARYSGSIFGIVWAFIQPLVTILVFWYVFQIGFKNPPVDNIEFILWYAAAYIPWIFFNDGFMSSTNVLYEYSYLVKKMKFKVWLLPIVKVLSALYIHCFFIIFVWGLFMLYGYSFNIHWFAVLYYSFAITMLLLGISYITSSISVFIKDNSQFINIFLQILFWMTPIFWADSTMNANVLKILKLNPMYYIITGYRNALIYNKGILEQSSKLMVLYWSYVVIVLLIGIRIYKKLRVHYSDLL